MPTINTNSRPFTDTLERGNALTVTCDASGTALVNLRGPSGLPQQSSVAAGRSVVYGPYLHDMSVVVSMAAGSAMVTESIADALQFANVPQFSLDPTTGAVTGLVGPDGGLIELDAPLTATSIADWVALTSTGAVCGSPCLINRIRCITGSAVTLTVYDNAAASSGTVLYTGSLSAGQEASVPTPLRAINGVRAAFASGSFEFQIQQEAA